MERSILLRFGICFLNRYLHRKEREKKEREREREGEGE